MSYCDLLERMMQRDTDAFLEMTERYGWALYSEIRKKTPNKAEADRIYDETMQQFYRSLQNPACEDPMEALLCAFADKLSDKRGVSADFLSASYTEDDLQPPPVQVLTANVIEKPKPRKRKGRFWFRMAMFLLLICFAAVIWMGIGLLMVLEYLPFYDLGYSWFFDLVTNWI